MLITGIIKESFQEYSGEASLVLFSHGCNLRCPECYNLSTILDSSKIIGEAFEIIDENINPLHTAVVFLGGEPTIWHDLPDIARYVKSKNLKTKLYSNGQHYHMIHGLLRENLIDAYSIDLKTIKDNNVIGKNIYTSDYVKKVLTTIEDVISFNKQLEVRTTKWDSVNIDSIKKFMQEHYPQIPHIIQDKFITPSYNI